MPIIVKRRPLPNHPNYAAVCKQTITLYNVWKEGSTQNYHKTVFHGSAFLESKKIYQEGRTGVTASNSALLVVPQGASGKTYIDPVAFEALSNKADYFTLRNGDKVVHGVGDDITTATEWANLIPSRAPGIVILSAVDVKRNLSGDIVHAEAGG